MIIGYFFGFLMGGTLGLLGAGGSILTVPILIYFFQIPPLTATGYSLVVVGSIALVGALRYSRQKLVDCPSVAIFCIPSVVAVLLTRTLLIPNLPNPIFGISKDAFVIFLFGLLMLASAFFMLRRSRITPVAAPDKPLQPLSIALLMVCTAGVGVLTGLVGAGGGFLIVPTLTGLFKLPIKKSVGTSLAIIACNALTGFNGDLLIGQAFDWSLLTKFLAVTLIGMFVGTALNNVVESARLCKLFAVFTFVVAVCMLAEQFYNI
jgi:uncharacterized membrane protein YfcA